MNRAVCTIAPMLSVRRGSEAVDFYQRALGADVVFRVDAPDGAIVARLAISGAEFWVADESPEQGNFSPETLGGGTTRMVLVVADPDAVQAQAIAAGALEITAVEDNYGWRLGRIADPFGHHWEIGHPLESAS